MTYQVNNSQQARLREPETVLLAGGSGYVGRAIARLLIEHGHRVMVATRSPTKTCQQLGLPTHKRLAVTRLYGKHLPWQPTAIINLCGENIGKKRWTNARKQVLLDSRISTSQYLVGQCFHQWRSVKTFINASAIGYYGDTGAHWADEQTIPGADFGAQLCRQWESTIEVLPAKVRTANVRLGVVIGPPRKGSAMAKLLPLYKLGLGGTVASGNHWMSWIHRDDAARLFTHILENKSCRGPYNGCAPHPVKYKELNKRLSVQTKRLALFTTPAWLLKLLMGEMSSLLLSSQRISSNRAQQSGFRFLYSNLARAISQSVDAPSLTPIRPAAKPRPHLHPRNTAETKPLLQIVRPSTPHNRAVIASLSNQAVRHKAHSQQTFER